MKTEECSELKIHLSNELNLNGYGEILSNALKNKKDEFLSPKDDLLFFIDSIIMSFNDELEKYNNIIGKINNSLTGSKITSLEIDASKNYQSIVKMLQDIRDELVSEDN